MAIPRLLKYKTTPWVGTWGTLFEGFETFSDWTKILGDSIEANSINVREGVLSLKLNSVSGSEVTAQKTISQSFSAATNFTMWIYIHELSTLSNCILRFSSTTDFSKYFTLTMSANTFKAGWNRIAATKGQFADTGGESWSNTMVRMRVECTATGGNNTAASFDELRYSSTGMAACILTFDDGYDGVYDYAKPRMDTNMQDGVVFVVTDWVGQMDCMTKTELTTLQNAGWDICNHTKTHAHYASGDQVRLGWQWLVDNGFSQAAHFYAYPYGEYNDTVLKDVRQRHRLARTTIQATFQPHFNMLDNNIDLLLKCRQVDASVSPSTVQGWIDNAIAHKGLLILLFHDIVASGATGLQYNQADFNTVSDYLLANMSNIMVTPFTYYYNQLCPCPTNAIYLKNAAIVPYPITHQPLQTVNSTEGGQIKVYSHSLNGHKRRVWQIKCRIDNSEPSGYRWRELDSFYWDILEGGKNPCVFIDSNSFQYLVRVTGFEQRTITANENYEVTMLLEEDCNL